jgi:trafficking protein particle complex subunit 11
MYLYRDGMFDSCLLRKYFKMNSYPPELLTQLAPVMFVAGLDAPTIASSNLSAKAQDFNTLTLRLREALQAQRKVAFWRPEKSKTFQIVLVDKEVKFPPRKLVSQDDSQYTAAHSPLSPLAPTSPLYPDGLIAPIWIRKHTTLVPSVFVLFMRIFESPPHNSRTPLDVPSGERERDREQEERRRDTDLAAEVAMRKKSTNERGIKLTVVLMASRKMLGTIMPIPHQSRLNAPNI